MKTVRVVAAVIMEKDRIYATQRGYGEFKDGWEFPGGKIEPGKLRKPPWCARSGRSSRRRSNRSG